jgi:two-component system sensor histidine kinase GlrK
VRLQALIETLLSYAASQFHRVTLELKSVDVRHVINRVTDDQRLALRARDLEVQIAAEDVTLMADFEKLRIILDNLLSNAIKFSPPGGAISIGARTSGGQLELEVADTGPGIKSGERAHVFDPFFQGTQSVRGVVKGTGIGLSIVREYAQAHGGSVEVVERGGAPGALLRVRLPLVQAETVS